MSGRWNLAGMAVLLLAALLWRVFHPSGELATDLLFGWLSYLWRVTPQVQIRADGAAVCAVAMLVTLALLHSCCVWLFQGIRQSTHWRLRHSAAVLALLLLVFVAGISVIGATHQTLWMAGSDQTLFSEQMDDTHWSRESNLRWIGATVQFLPSEEGELQTRGWHEQQNVPRHSWATHLLPWLNFYPEGFNAELEWRHPDNREFFSRLVPVLLNGDLRQTTFRTPQGCGVSHFAGNTHLFDSTDVIRLSELDRGSTILIGEVRDSFRAWGDPCNNRDPRRPFGSAEGFGGASAGFVTFLMADGSIRDISTDVDPKVIQSLSAASR